MKEDDEVGKDRLLIYGANGTVGRAAARLAAEQGLEPVLAGRSRQELEALAAELGCTARVFSLDEPAQIAAALRDVRVVLHLAGPYVWTSEPMASACLRTGTHYLDITGELPVLQALAARDAEARSAGVMLLPAVGLDSVPSDCLAAHLLRRLPQATRVTLGLRTRGPAGLPPGTQRTMIELAHLHDRVVRGGNLVERRGSDVPTRLVDFGDGPEVAVRFPAPDTFVVWRTTGVPEVTMYVALPLALRLGYRLLRLARPVFRWRALRRLLQRLVLPAASPEALERSATRVWAEAGDDVGGLVSARLDGPEGAIVWTARSALAVVGRVLAGDAPPGFQTPAGAYGPDLVLECAGVQRFDLA